MTNTASQSLITELLAFVEAGEHTQFQFLRNLQDYVFTCNVKHTIRVLIKNIQSSADKLFATYCKEIRHGSADFDKLLVYQSLVRIIAFYGDELLIMNDMIDEYETYLMSGNIINALLQEQRPFSELYDFRGNDK